MHTVEVYGFRQGQKFYVTETNDNYHSIFQNIIDMRALALYAFMITKGGEYYYYHEILDHFNSTSPGDLRGALVYLLKNNYIASNENYIKSLNIE